VSPDDGVVVSSQIPRSNAGADHSFTTDTIVMPSAVWAASSEKADPSPSRVAIAHCEQSLLTPVYPFVRITLLALVNRQPARTHPFTNLTRAELDPSNLIPVLCPSLYPESLSFLSRKSFIVRVH
jgi:hypothetical protein